MLEKAQHDIEVLAFSFAIGSINGRINKSSAPYKVAEKLVELKKTKKHLNIRVYMEGVRSTSARNFITSHFLEEAGIIVEFGATHAKGFCVDHHLTLVGSTNLTNQSLVKNYEANLLIDDVDVAVEFHRYFEHLWAGGQHGRIRLHEPLIADGDFEEVLLKMIRSAQKTLEFSIYFFDHKKIYAALIEAHERGVHIKGFGLYHPRFALSYVYRTRRTIEGLRKIGVTDLHFSNASNFAHSKYLIRIEQKFC